MYFLTSPDQRLQCATSGPISLPYTALDFTTVYVVNSERNDTTRGPVSVTGYIDDSFRNLAPAIPSESTQYNVQSIHVVNSDSITHTLTFRLVDNGNARKLFNCTLSPGQSVAYYNEQGWTVYNSNGSSIANLNGLTYPIHPSDSASYSSVGGDSIMTNDLIDGYTPLQLFRAIINTGLIQ